MKSNIPSVQAETLVLVREWKMELRKKHIYERALLTDRDRVAKSDRIWEILSASDEFGNAQSIMIYMHFGQEVQTHRGIRNMFENKNE